MQPHYYLFGSTVVLMDTIVLRDARLPRGRKD